jgi:DNA-binding transcriptional ArsR family regulator
MQLHSDVESLFEVMADPTRRRIVVQLGERPHRPGELARSLGTSASSMSRHLRVLLENGVVVDDRPEEDARGRTFRLRPQPFTALVAWADQMQALWGEQLGSFQEHVERTRPRKKGHR